MKSLRISILSVCLSMISCTKLPDTIPLPTKVTGVVKHHSALVPDTRVYIKYNTTVFPGYDTPTSFFDDSTKANKQAMFTFESLPEGTHWMAAFGYDSLYFPHHVFGSMQVTLSLAHQPVIDTIFYISE